MCNRDPTTNTCRMDGLSTTGCPSGNCSFTFVKPSDVGPYLTIARQYGWANFMFQTNQGPSTPAHQFIFGGTSAPTANDDAQATFVAEQPQNGPGSGCLAPLGEYYWMISPQTAPDQFTLVNNALGTLCFSHPTMATLLDNHVPALSWKYYTPGVNSIWTAPNWIREICVPDSNYQNCTGTEWKNNVDLNPADVLTDIGACKPAEHDLGDSDGTEFRPSRIMAARVGLPGWLRLSMPLGKARARIPTAAAIGTARPSSLRGTIGEAGMITSRRPSCLCRTQGQGDYQYGFRVPLLVVSAYTPRGYVNNGRHDFGSILRFVEHNFGITGRCAQLCGCTVDNRSHQLF